MSAEILSIGSNIVVTKGAFAGRLGMVFDPKNPRYGNRFLRTPPGSYWVMLTLNATPLFPACFFDDEIEAAATPI